MKLLMGDEVFVPEDQVIIRLVRSGSDIHLTMQKKGKVEQIVLQFFSEGTIGRPTVYEDVGFNRDEKRRLVISG